MTTSQSCLETLNIIRREEEILVPLIGREQAHAWTQQQTTAFIRDMHQAALSTAQTYRSFFTRMLDDKDAETALFMRENIYQALRKLAASVDMYEEGGHTSQHLDRVEQYAGLLSFHHISRHQAAYPQYDPEQYSRDVAKVAPLHDIGKVCLPKDLIDSSQRYSSDAAEREIMKVHVECGAIMLDIPGKERGKETRINLALHVIRGHHSPEYGPGNPRPSLAAAIVKVVDVLDAGTSIRPYKAALPFDKVVDEWIMNHRGTRFDPEVADTFYTHRTEFRDLHDRLHAPA